MQPVKPNQLEKISAFEYRIWTEIVIETSAEQVWAILMDPVQLARWSTSFLGLQGDLRKGGPATAHFLFMGREVWPKHTLTDFVPERVFSWADPIIPGLRDQHQYLLEPLTPTQTRFVQSDRVHGLLAPLLGHWLSKQLFELYLDFNQKLKQAAESQGES